MSTTLAMFCDHLAIGMTYIHLMHSPTALWHVPYVETVHSLLSLRENLNNVRAYMTTEVLNCLFEVSRTEFLPGPDAESLVLKSVRSTKLSEDA
jgi:hypothetical protein